jgi:Kef-type K+ transport system membrane component KefB
MEHAPAKRRRGRGRMAGAYAAMIAAGIAAFWFISALGTHLAPPGRSEAPAAGAPPGTDDAQIFFHVLLALVAVIAAARLLGALFRRLQQPPVIGEVIAGILLGPSFFGQVAPTAAAYLLPPAIAPFLNILAQVGVVLFMFLVGLELDTAALRQRTHVTVAISHASILVPFVLGSALALWLYPHLATSSVPFTPFALFMGASMSVTAFPVLARILRDRGIQRTPLGSIALTCAAVDDVTAWCLLAFVVSVARARLGGVLPTVLLTVVYIVAMFSVVRPLVQRLLRRHPQVTQTATAGALVALLCSALVTESIGIHAVFGAFFLGAVIPHDSAVAQDLCHKLDDLVVVLLLPAFFAFTGMHTRIALVSGPVHWLMCAAIMAVACLGKFGGSTLAARVMGLTWRDAASLGVLMNTRGLIELVVLNIGLELQVITPTLFAMMVLMALGTTLATAPLLHLLMRGHVEVAAVGHGGVRA